MVSKEYENYERHSDVHFIDHNNGWTISPMQGILYHSSDGGESWKQQYKFEKDTIINIYFQDNSTGWGVGYNGSVFHTSNGGDSWIKFDLNTNVTLCSVYFNTRTSGWIVGHDGVIFQTSDGGDNWNRVETDAETNKYIVRFSNSTHGWVAGGDVLYTTDGGLTFVNEHITGKEHSLKCSPNPIRNEAGIEYKIENSGRVEISLHDIYGREVMQITSEYHAAGDYSKTFGAAALTPGIYIIRMDSGGKIWSEKIIVLK
jgi:photosystem II stability/assembly factor-like uncharacterized protein